MLYSLLRFWLSLNHSTITLERTIRRNALGLHITTLPRSSGKV
jgi:hypothetical protein